VVVLEDAPAARALRRAAGLLGRRLGAVLAVGGAGLAAALAGMALYALLDRFVDYGGWPGIVAGLALAQALAVSRHLARTVVVGAEAQLVRAAAPGRAQAAGEVVG
jgi:hypothetical protein